MRSASSGRGSRPGLTATVPSSTTCETISIPYAWRSRLRATTPERHPGRGLPGAGPLQDRPGVGVPVLLHPGQVGVAGPGAGQRRVAGQPVQHGRVDRVGRHHGLPLGPLAVGHPDRHRAAEAQSVSDPADDLDLVLLERHPRAPAVAEAAPGQAVRHLGRGHLHPGRHALEDGDERGPVRLTRGQPAQAHGSQSVTGAPRRSPASWASRCSGGCPGGCLGGPTWTARASGAAPTGPAPAMIANGSPSRTQPVQPQHRVAQRRLQQQHHDAEEADHPAGPSLADHDQQRRERRHQGQQRQQPAPG